MFQKNLDNRKLKFSCVPKQYFGNRIETFVPSALTHFLLNFLSHQKTLSVCVSFCTKILNIYNIYLSFAPSTFRSRYIYR